MTESPLRLLGHPRAQAPAAGPGLRGAAGDSRCQDHVLRAVQREPGWGARALRSSCSRRSCRCREGWAGWATRARGCPPALPAAAAGASATANPPQAGWRLVWMPRAAAAAAAMAPGSAAQRGCPTASWRDWQCTGVQSPAKGRWVCCQTAAPPPASPAYLASLAQRCLANSWHSKTWRQSQAAAERCSRGPAAAQLAALARLRQKS